MTPEQEQRERKLCKEWLVKNHKGKLVLDVPEVDYWLACAERFMPVVDAAVNANREAQEHDANLSGGFCHAKMYLLLLEVRQVIADAGLTERADYGTD